jgi:hypothetical protein
MLENRAFDHMVGHLMSQNPEITGIDGTETIPYQVNDTSKGFAKISFNATYSCNDPGKLFKLFFFEMRKRKFLLSNNLTLKYRSSHQ